MDIGVFIPIGNNGWLVSTTSPQYMPTFDLNREITQRAERYGLDFALSMIKLRGFGGPSEFWDHNLESFTLMAGLAAVTKRIQLYASVAVLTIPPAIVARMAATIDSIAPGRFGVNIVSGWQKAEYDQMGLWPGEAHFGMRYEYSEEYVRIMRELWATGQSDLKGRFFQMNDCRLSPRPKAIKIVSAGQSPRGMQFAAEHADYNFIASTGLNTPRTIAPMNQKLMAEAAKTGRDVGSYVLLMVIADETDAAAMAKWQRYNAGADHEALAWMRSQAGADVNAAAISTAKQMAMSAEASVNFNMCTLVGSYAKVAALLDEYEDIPGTKGLMLTFDDFLIGLEQFGTRIQPLMKSRGHVKLAA